MFAVEHLISGVNLGDSIHLNLNRGTLSTSSTYGDLFQYVGAAWDVCLVKSLLCLSCLSTFVLSRGH
jgi:hypothetical protein